MADAGGGAPGAGWHRAASRVRNQATLVVEGTARTGAATALRIQQAARPDTLVAAAAARILMLPGAAAQGAAALGKPTGPTALQQELHTGGTLLAKTVAIEQRGSLSPPESNCCYADRGRTAAAVTEGSAALPASTPSSPCNSGEHNIRFVILTNTTFIIVRSYLPMLDSIEASHIGVD